MDFIDLQKPMVISKDRLKAFLQNDSSEMNASSFGIYFPHLPALSGHVSMYDLLTPWGSDLEGLRMSLFNNTQPRILIRASGKVSWSKVIEGQDYALILEAFLDKIENGFTYIRRLTGTLPPVIYSMETCAQLLKSSFLDKAKPRLIPRIQLPSQSDCVDAFKSARPVPWEESDHSGRRSLKHIDGKYVFEVLGERGERDFIFSSPQLEEAQWSAFKYLTWLDYLQNDLNFVFDDAHFPA